MNHKLFIEHVIILFLLFLIISKSAASQEVVHSNGYWRLQDIRVVEKEAVFNEKTEGKRTIFATITEGKVEIKKTNPLENNNQPNFHAQFTWDKIPEILIPDKEYNLNITAQLLVNIKPGNNNIDASLNISTTPYCINEEFFEEARSYQSIDNASVSTGMEALKSTNDFLYQSKNVTINPPAYCGEYWTREYPGKDVFYLIRVSAIEMLKKSGARYYYLYKWIGENPAILLEGGVKNTEYALKITSSPDPVKPDGQSTVKISGILYSYTPDDNNSSKALPGKTLTFEIQSLDKIKPGTLSSTSSVTDADGTVTLTYTTPTVETLEKMEPMNRSGIAVKIRNDELNAEDLAYITFRSDKGKMWVEPGMSILSDTGFVPPDKRYPALISANFYEGNLEPIANSEVTFSIKENNPVGMLRSSDGSVGKQITLKTDASGAASVQYYYAASNPPEKPITETIEAKTTNMSAPFKAYVSTGFNLVIDDAKSGYESSKEINAGEEIPLHITVRDQWHPNHDLGYMMNYWGDGNLTGNSKLFVKLEIEKQGFVPSYVSDLLEKKFYPEPLYTEVLSILPLTEIKVKNLLFIPKWSLKNYGYPQVKPLFSGINNYEIRVTMVDEKGVPVFESQHPRRSAFVSIPTGLPASTFRIYFLSNPLGPHTEMARFGRLILNTISFGELGGLGAILSIADAATAINTGDAEALANVMLSAVKEKVLGDAGKKAGITGERFATYNNMSMAEQYVSYALTTHSDKGLIAQMENKILSGIAGAGSGDDKQMVVLKGDGNQKLIVEAGQKPESKASKTLKDNFKISIKGFDKKTTEFLEKFKKKDNNKGEEIPFAEGKYTYDEKLNTVSLKNGNVSIYVIPIRLKVMSENTLEMKTY